MLQFPLEVTDRGWTRIVDRLEMFGSLGASHRRRLNVSLPRQLGRVFLERPFFKRQGTDILVSIPSFEISQTATMPNVHPLDIGTLGAALTQVTQSQIKKETEIFLDVARSLTKSEGYGPEPLDAGPILDKVFRSFDLPEIRPAALVMSPLTYLRRVFKLERGNPDYIMENRRETLKRGIMGHYKGIRVMQSLFVPPEEVVAFGKRSSQDERDNPYVLDLILRERRPATIELNVIDEMLQVQAIEEIGMAVGQGFAATFKVEDSVQETETNVP